MSLNALAEGGGHEVGNGGNSIVCETVNATGEKTKYAHVLDLYEARELYRLEPVTNTDGLSEKPLARQIVSKLEALDETYAQLVRVQLEDVVRKISLLAPGQGLTPIPDSFHVSYPKYCDIKQLANYTKEFGILIDQDIWNLLDPINRAGLFVHEAVYKTERDLFGATDSISARKIVAYLFSKSALTPEIWRKEIRPDAKLQFERFGRNTGNHGVTRSNSAVEYTLRNVGNGTSSKIAIAIESSSPKMWALNSESDECSGKSLDSNESCRFKVTFRAGENGQTAGTYSAVLNADATVGGKTSQTIFGTSQYAWTTSTHWSVEFFDDVASVEAGFPCMARGASYYQKVAHIPSGVQYLYQRDSNGDALCHGRWYYQIPPNAVQNKNSGLLRECNIENPVWPSNDRAGVAGRFEFSYLCAPVGSPDTVWGNGNDGATVGSCNKDRTFVVKPYFCF